jgi:hypothetical protein
MSPTRKFIAGIETAGNGRSTAYPTDSGRAGPGAAIPARPASGWGQNVHSWLRLLLIGALLAWPTQALASTATAKIAVSAVVMPTCLIRKSDVGAERQRPDVAVQCQFATPYSVEYQPPRRAAEITRSTDADAIVISVSY